MVELIGMTKEHWHCVKGIYMEGIKTGNATFEQEVPEWEEWDKNHLEHSRIIVRDSSNVVGWAALTGVSGRCVYAGVAEVSVYVAEAYRGQKMGSLLLQELIKESETNNIWTLQAGIFPENKGSIQIHETNGFRIVGYRERIGQMNGIWRDALLMERRSQIVGTKL